MTTREELRRKGDEILKRLGHGTNPPRAKPLPTSSIPGLQHYGTESIFGSVWARPGLDLRYRMLVTLSVLTSLQRLQQLRTYINSALNLGLGPEEIQEVFIQCALYAGVPTQVNSLVLAEKVFEQRGVKRPPTEVPELTLEEMEARGRARRAEMVGETPGGYVDAIETLAPELRKTMFQYGFGEVYYRPGLDLKSRVVCVIAALTAVRAEPQLRNFLNAGLRVGLSREQVIEVLVQVGPYAGFPATVNALAVAQQHLPAGP